MHESAKSSPLFMSSHEIDLTNNTMSFYLLINVTPADVRAKFDLTADVCTDPFTLSASRISFPKSSYSNICCPSVEVTLLFSGNLYSLGASK